MYNLYNIYSMGKNHNYSFAGIATVGPKGQIVIPAEVREKMSIGPGDKLITLYLEEKQAVGFVTEAQAQTIVNQMGKKLDVFRSIIGGKN